MTGKVASTFSGDTNNIYYNNFVSQSSLCERLRKWLEQHGSSTSGAHLSPYRAAMDSLAHSERLCSTPPLFVSRLTPDKHAADWARTVRRHEVFQPRRQVRGRPSSSSDLHEKEGAREPCKIMKNNGFSRYSVS